MERPSISTEQLAELRIEVRELQNDSEWRHQSVMAEFADIHEALSRRPFLGNPESWIKVAPVIAALALPLLVLLLTGNPDKAMQAATAGTTTSTRP